MHKMCTQITNVINLRDTPLRNRVLAPSFVMHPAKNNLFLLVA